VGEIRWYVKKGARTGMMLASELSGATMLARSSRTPSVRVLTYHRIGPTRHDPFCVAVEDFERQMAWLARHAPVVRLADVEAFLAGRQIPSDGAVLVTIDDGSPTLVRNALPILERHRIPAVAFVPAGELGQGRTGLGVQLDGPHARITCDELADLAARGITIGSHAWTHRSLTRMAAAEMQDEVVRSRDALARWTGQTVTAFAYPFGTRADSSAAAVAALRAAGYTCAFTSQHGAVRRDSDPFLLPRVKVEGGEGPRMFRRLVRGGLDGWRWVDRALWPLQARTG
jgi:peptidoglycan/xylan/chitin deacetylase (PgdA/CDA1 family)